MDYIPPGSPVLGISQARILEWVAISFSIYILDVMLNTALMLFVIIVVTF